LISHYCGLDEVSVALDGPAREAVGLIPAIGETGIAGVGAEVVNLANR